MKFQPKLFVTIPYIKLGYAKTKLPIFVVLAVAVGVDVVAGVVVAVVVVEAKKDVPGIGAAAATSRNEASN